MTAERDFGFEHAPLGLVVSRRRTIARCNLRFCEMFDWPRERLEGRSLAMLYPSADEFQRIGEIGLARMRRSGCYDDERIMKRRDGTLFWCRVHGRSPNLDDPFAEAVWSFADLSEKRPVAALGPREREIAMLLLGGRTSKEIAAALGLSPRTVEAHRARLMAKFEARNTAELVARLSGLPM
jgi:PAS domain S-box-containing protein